jgi:hypothetical protein
MTISDVDKKPQELREKAITCSSPTYFKKMDVINASRYHFENWTPDINVHDSQTKFASNKEKFNEVKRGTLPEQLSFLGNCLLLRTPRKSWLPTSVVYERIYRFCDAIDSCLRLVKGRNISAFLLRFLILVEDQTTKQRFGVRKLPNGKTTKGHDIGCDLRLCIRKKSDESESEAKECRDVVYTAWKCVLQTVRSMLTSMLEHSPDAKTIKDSIEKCEMEIKRYE